MPEKTSRPPLPALAPFVLLTAAVLLAYANVYRNEFLFDDLVLVAGNKFLTSWRHAGALLVTHTCAGYNNGQFHDPFWRPLQMLLYLFVYQAAGPAPAAFHLLNVALHAANACLLYLLGLRLGFARAGALAAALLWALHPVHTEAVTYISATADPLHSLFLIAGMLVLAAGFDRRRVTIAGALFLGALLSKESAVVFPLLAMALLFFRGGERWAARAYLKTWPFWLMTALYLLARATVLNFGGFFGAYQDTGNAHLTIIDRLYTSMATLPTYLRLVVWPAGLHMERDFPAHTALFSLPVLGGFAIAAASALFVIRRPASPLAWGLLWAAAAHIPQSGILAPNDAFLYEHWLYLPTAGLALGLGQSAASWLAGKPKPALAMAVAAVAVAAPALGAKTFLQNRVWRDGGALFENVLRSGENTERARFNLGDFYMRRGEFDRALEQFNILLALPGGTLARWPQLHFVTAAAWLHVNTGMGGLQNQLAEIRRAVPLSGHVPAAITELNKALMLDPGHFWANEMLAEIYAFEGDRGRANYYAARAAAAMGKRRLP